MNPHGSAMASTGTSTQHVEEASLLIHDLDPPRQDLTKSHQQARDCSQHSHSESHDGQDHDQGIGLRVVTQQMRKSVMMDGLVFPFHDSIAIHVNQDRHKFHRNYDSRAVELWSLTNLEKSVLGEAEEDPFLYTIDTKDIPTVNRNIQVLENRLKNILATLGDGIEQEFASAFANTVKMNDVTCALVQEMIMKSANTEQGDNREVHDLIEAKSKDAQDSIMNGFDKLLPALTNTSSTGNRNNNLIRTIIEQITRMEVDMIKDRDENKKKFEDSQLAMKEVNQNVMNLREDIERLTALVISVVDQGSPHELSASRIEPPLRHDTETPLRPVNNQDKATRPVMNIYNAHLGKPFGGFATSTVTKPKEVAFKSHDVNTQTFTVTSEQQAVLDSTRQNFARNLQTSRPHEKSPNTEKPNQDPPTNVTGQTYPDFMKVMSTMFNNTQANTTHELSTTKLQSLKIKKFMIKDDIVAWLRNFKLECDMLGVLDSQQPKLVIMNLDEATKNIFMNHVEQRKSQGVNVLKLDMDTFEDELRNVFMTRLGKLSDISRMNDFKQGSLTLEKYFEMKTNLMNRAGKLDIMQQASHYIGGLRPEYAKQCAQMADMNNVRSCGEIWKIMKDAYDHVNTYDKISPTQSSSRSVYFSKKSKQRSRSLDGHKSQASSHDSSRDSSRNGSRQRDSSRESVKSTTPYCKHHPDATSHWTSECRTTNNGKSRSKDHDSRSRDNGKSGSRNHDSKNKKSFGGKHETPKRSHSTKYSKKNNQDHDDSSGNESVPEDKKGDSGKPSSPQ